jgi:predicted phosphodiesterase
MKSLLLSDVHGNWPALQAVLAAEPDVDRVLCLGDLVGYGPQPAECVAWAMGLNSASVVIQGNHDRHFAVGRDPQCAPANRPFAQAIAAATNGLLTPDMKRFLARLQPLEAFCWDGHAGVACHLLPKGPLRAPFEHEDAKWPWESDIILVGVADIPFVMVGHPGLLFLGHAHTPVETHWGRTLVVNPGSVGRPTDGDPRAAYAVWADGGVALHRLAYEVEETVRAYESLPLDPAIKQGLVRGLRTGTGWSLCPTEELATKG